MNVSHSPYNFNFFVGDACEKLGEAAFVVASSRSESESDDGDDQPAVKWLTDPLAPPRHEDDSDSDSEPEDERSLSPEADDCACKSLKGQP